MAEKKRLPKSIRKFIRLEKARIRRQILDLNEKNKLISDLYQKFPRTKNKVLVQGESNIEPRSSVGFKTI